MARSLTKREKWLLILAGSFGALYLFYRLVFFPQWEDYLMVQEELKSKQNSLITIQKIYSKVQQLTRENDKKLNALNNLKAFNTGNDGTILLRLDDIATEQDLKIKLYQPQPVASGQIPSKNVEAKITGTYDGIIGFFKELDNLPYLTKIMVREMKPVAFEQDNGFRGNILQDEAVVSFSLQIFNMPEIKPSKEPPKKPIIKVRKKPKPQNPQIQTTNPNLPILLVPEGETTVEKAYLQ